MTDKIIIIIIIITVIRYLQLFLQIVHDSIPSSFCLPIILKAPSASADPSISNPPPPSPNHPSTIHTSHYHNPPVSSDSAPNTPNQHPSPSTPSSNSPNNDDQPHFPPAEPQTPPPTRAPHSHVTKIPNSASYPLQKTQMAVSHTAHSEYDPIPTTSTHANYTRLDAGWKVPQVSFSLPNNHLQKKLLRQTLTSPVGELIMLHSLLLLLKPMKTRALCPKFLEARSVNLRR